jgi:uncharacterized protein (DUF608 family)
MRATRVRTCRPGPQRSYPSEATEAAFLLGGIGTGNVSIGARGELRDWEIFNKPGKGRYLPFTFFAIRAQAAGRPPVAKVLEARVNPPYSRSHGYYHGAVAGLPRLRHATMRAEYPFVWIDFEDPDLPVTVSLEAFTPFVPLDADASGIPGAILRYRVRNETSTGVDVRIVGSLANAVGSTGYGPWFYPEVAGRPRNTYRDDGLRGLFLDNPGLEATDLRAGSMVLATTADSVTSRDRWLEGSWLDAGQDFWDGFRADGRLARGSHADRRSSAVLEEESPTVGSLAVERWITPGDVATIEYLLTWHFPNRPRAWGGHQLPDANADQLERNHYATLFDDAWHVARYLVEDLRKLEDRSRDFRRALFGSTLPPAVIDAVAANITVLRSTTCFRIADGTLLGWEGTFDDRGCCEGSCTHVWNYAQTAAFLFPELERTMRRVEFLLETDASGRMAFRTNRVFGAPTSGQLPAADGQLGTIVRLYRDWRISGDDAYLRELWPAAKRALDFAFSYWDSDGDFVLDGEQHNTYDVEFHGQSSMTTSIGLAALAAAAAIAAHLGEAADADRYRAALAAGSARMDELLWDGEYYIQRIDDVDAHRYQYGRGCLSDQVVGQLFAHVAGLGYVLPAEHVRGAVEAVYRHNFRASLADHHSLQRTYALNDEAGLLLCSWPKGGRPRLPFIYADEVWTGVEYQVAAHLIYEGLVDEGLAIVEAVRERHDGLKRNPWNEVECGNHYARSMASWAVYLALTGMRADLVERTLSFDPAVNARDFSGFWITDRGWGIYRQRIDPSTGEVEIEAEVLHGTLGDVAVSSHSTGGHTPDVTTPGT